MSASGIVTSCQCAPPSRVSWIFPSSVLTQISPGATGDGTMSRIVSYVSAPVTSSRSGVPERI